MGGKNVTVQVEKYYQSHTDEPFSSNTGYSTKNMTHVFRKHCFFRHESKVQQSTDHIRVIAKYLWITSIMRAVKSHDYNSEKGLQIHIQNQAFK